MTYNLIISPEEKKNIKAKSNVYNILKNSIQFLEIKPGTRIIESELSAELGVSRTPIREALLRLSNERLVEIFPQKGTYVTKIDMNLAEQMAYMRNILETDVLMKLCNEKAKIREVVAEPLFFLKLASDKSNLFDYMKRDEDFHGALFSHVGLDMVWSIISNNRSHYNRILVLDMMLPDSMKDSYQSHLEIVECIENGNEKGLLKLLDSHHQFRDPEDILRLHSDYFVD